VGFVTVTDMVASDTFPFFPKIQTGALTGEARCLYMAPSRDDGSGNEAAVGGTIIENRIPIEGIR
jgi:hypothetical protein